MHVLIWMNLGNETIHLIIMDQKGLFAIITYKSTSADTTWIRMTCCQCLDLHRVLVKTVKVDWKAFIPGGKFSATWLACNYI